MVSIKCWANKEAVDRLLFISEKRNDMSDEIDGLLASLAYTFNDAVEEGVEGE